MASAAITADCFWSAGYLATSSIDFGILQRARLFPAPVFAERSAVDLAEHDVLRADDGTTSAIMWPRDISSSAAGAQSRARASSGGTACWRRRTRIDAELALRDARPRHSLARRHVHAFGEQLEVVDQLFHVGLHRLARRRRHLVVVGDHRTGILAQPVDALLMMRFDWRISSMRTR
jgi:hypothetical protein